MNPVPMTAEVIILAGGLGTRLQGMLGDVPKCMAPIAGKPFLEYQLAYLQSMGHTHIILSVGHLRTPIMEHFGEHWMDCSIRYSVEEAPLGTGGAILQAIQMCTTDLVLVLNGDTYFPVDTRPMFEHLTREQADAVIALRRVPDAGRYGRVETDKRNRILLFREKLQNSGDGLINGGIYLLRKEIILDSGMQGTFSLEKDIFPGACSSNIMMGVEFGDYFLDIGIPADLDRAQQELPSIG